MTQSDTQTDTTMTLPDGRVAEWVEPKGRHMVRGARMAGSNDPIAMMYGLIAATVTIDGQALTYEDVLDLPLGALNPLMTKVAGGNGPSLPGSTSLS